MDREEMELGTGCRCLIGKGMEAGPCTDQMEQSSDSKIVPAA